MGKPNTKGNVTMKYKAVSPYKYDVHAYTPGISLYCIITLSH
jgi:hypothetical protein